MKNLKRMETEVGILQELAKPSPKLQEYETTRIELCKKHAKKNDQGVPVIVDNNYEIAEEAAFEAELAKLRMEYEEVIKEQEDRVNKLNDILKEESDVQPYQIKLEELPSDLVPSIIRSLSPIIAD
jgi:hypothetical protein